MSSFNTTKGPHKDFIKQKLSFTHYTTHNNVYVHQQFCKLPVWWCCPINLPVSFTQESVYQFLNGSFA